MYDASTLGSDLSHMLLFWGKTKRGVPGDSEGLKYHPLLFHMLDVAAVAQLIWDNCLPQVIKDDIELVLGPNSRDIVIFLAGAHDIGKANPAFQKMKPEIATKLECLGFRFSRNDISKPHGFVTAATLMDFYERNESKTILAKITGAHHGTFPRSFDLRLGQDTLGDRLWHEARNMILTEYTKTIGIDLENIFSGLCDIDEPVLVPVLAGFISVVDWIGSNQDYFPCELGVNGLVPSCGDYWVEAKKRAENALRYLGWMPTIEMPEEASFDKIFNGLQPNLLQQRVAELIADCNKPYLMAIEAPMGLGKTEAAIFAADHAMCRGFAKGMYIAMPTQATSNAMYKRVLNDYLKHRGIGGNLNLRLVHGDALLAIGEHVQEGEFVEFKPISTESGDLPQSDVLAQSWFSARKRPLLAPFGVGTIDQSLMSVLQTKHWFVRLFGLAGKVIVFDEVHAYDAYMLTILERLLRWLAEVDCTVILLSATLPDARRIALARAYAGDACICSESYPRITFIENPGKTKNLSKNGKCVKVPTDKGTDIYVQFIRDDLNNLADLINELLREGGCAAFVCNTVDRSIEAYKHLKARLQDTECFLFHARTLQKWRREWEESVLRKFGKNERTENEVCVNSHRPKRALLVATQVIEQSLDLDFDFMVSELAPIDLLLQRCGRLHRHQRSRPHSLSKPTLCVLVDAEKNGPPPESFGKYLEAIYERYFLLRTWLCIRERCKFNLPYDVEDMIEKVYGDSELAYDDTWKAALEKERTVMEKKRELSAFKAESLLVGSPKHALDLLEEFNFELKEDDDPSINERLRAATRQGHPAITVVLFPQGEPLPDVYETEVVRKVLDYSVKISNPSVFQALLNSCATPEEWVTNPYLRHARLLTPESDGWYVIGNHRMKADKELGVVIKKDGENHG